MAPGHGGAQPAPSAPTGPPTGSHSTSGHRAAGSHVMARTAGALHAHPASSHLGAPTWEPPPGDRRTTLGVPLAASLCRPEAWSLHAASSLGRKQERSRPGWAWTPGREEILEPHLLYRQPPHRGGGRTAVPATTVQTPAPRCHRATGQSPLDLCPGPGARETTAVSQRPGVPRFPAVPMEDTATKGRLGQPPGAAGLGRPPSPSAPSSSQ